MIWVGQVDMAHPAAVMIQVRQVDMASPAGWYDSGRTGGYGTSSLLFYR